MSTRSFDVEGMTCAACARRVEKALASTPGVDRATVNLALNRATIEGAEELDEHLAVEAVRSVGYGLAPRGGHSGHDEHGGHDHGIALGREANLTAAALRRFWIAAVLSAPIVVLGMFGPEDELWPKVISLALIVPVQFWAAWPFLRSAWMNARHWGTNMDTLVAIGTLAATGFSVYALWRHGRHAHVYFETAAVIITFLLLGKYLEHRSKNRASSAITALMDRAPRTANVVDDGVETSVPVERISIGDTIRVRPGELVPLDGVIVAGDGALDESMLSGESNPLDKSVGDEVFAATLNLTGSLMVEVTRRDDDSAVARIAKLIEDAQARKAPIEQLADRISAIFVPSVLVLATATTVAWLLTGHSFEASLLNAVAVLIIACPCAMGLATPAAVVVGTGRGAQLGILIKGGDVLERSGAIDTVVFDKTGTLTEGEMTVVDVVPAAVANHLDVSGLLRLAASVEIHSEHPIAKAIVRAAEARDIAIDPAEGFVTTSGSGTKGQFESREVVVGRKGMLKGSISEELQVRADRLEAEGKTVVWVGEGERSMGVIALADRIRPSTPEAVARLRSLGLQTRLLTGDNERTAAAVAKAAGIEHVIAGVLPEGKVDAIRELKASGRVVAMVGDGINDAPALTEADLGVAVGTGADVAIEAADMTIVGGDPRAAAAAIELARATLRVIKQNLFWAFAYNVAALPLAAFGLLNPMIAAAAMALSSVSVVANALRLRRFSL